MEFGLVTTAACEQDDPPVPWSASWYGDCLPSRDFPMLVNLAHQGRFPLNDFITETISLDDVEKSFEKMHHGEILRSVVEL